MVEENRQSENEINDLAAKTPPPTQEYLAISTISPAKEVTLPKEGETGPKTLTESMDDATDLTDMQFAFKNMFAGNEQAKKRQFSRVSPEAFLSLLQFGLTSEIMTSNPNSPINVSKTLDNLYGDYTIGLNGEGRIDAAKLLGAAREIKKEENLIKGL